MTIKIYKKMMRGQYKKVMTMVKKMMIKSKRMVMLVMVKIYKKRMKKVSIQQ